MSSSEIVQRLIEKRVMRLARFCFTEMQRLRGREFVMHFGNLSQRVQAQYINLAGFIIINHLHPKLYLRVMKEYSINFYPTTLYGKGALEKYADYMGKIRRRYRTVKAFNVNDASLNILRNDLYTVAGILLPTSDPVGVYRDSKHRLAPLLRRHMDALIPVVDDKTVVVLRDIIRVGSVSGSKYSKQVTEAINVKGESS